MAWLVPCPPTPVSIKDWTRPWMDYISPKTPKCSSIKWLTLRPLKAIKDKFCSRANRIIGICRAKRVRSLRSPRLILYDELCPLNWLLLLQFVPSAAADLLLLVHLQTHEDAEAYLVCFQKRRENIARIDFAVWKCPLLLIVVRQILLWKMHCRWLWIAKGCFDIWWTAAGVSI